MRPISTIGLMPSSCLDCVIEAVVAGDSCCPLDEDIETDYTQLPEKCKLRSNIVVIMAAEIVEHYRPAVMISPDKTVKEETDP